MKPMVRVIVIVVVAVIVIVGVAWLFGLGQDLGTGGNGQPTTSSATTMPAAPATTTPVAPATTSLGAQVTYHNASSDLIRVITPQPGATVPRTFTVTGEARGNWYFEANFPIEVVNPAGQRLVVVPVQASGEWMTTDFVPFTVSVTVPGSYRGPATLVLHRDNPSGLPENDARMMIPVTIK